VLDQLVFLSKRGVCIYVKETFRYVINIFRQYVAKYLASGFKRKIFPAESRDHAGPDALTLQF
jgi:hypothetical protein